MIAVNKGEEIQKFEDIQLLNASLVGIHVSPLKKACLSFQTFPSKSKLKGEQYNLIFTQFLNFDFHIEHMPCIVKSLKTINDSAFLINALDNLKKVNTYIPFDDLVHLNLSFDRGNFDIIAGNYCLLKVWSIGH